MQENNTERSDPQTSTTTSLDPQPTNNASNISSSLPNYQEIARQVVSQLNLRKRTLFFRVLINIAPVLVGFILLYIAFGWQDDSNASESITTLQAILGGIGGGILALIAPAWVIITGIIFKTERRIWIDSFFDNVPLSTSESFKIAKKLFWPSIGLQITIFFRYYALILLASLLVILLGSYATIVLTNGENAGLIIFGIFSLTLAGVFIYVYITEIRLRYIWFIFLDNYGTKEYTHKIIFTRMKELNSRLKQEDFKKLMVTTLGIDAVGAGTNFVINEASKGISKLGPAGELIGGVTNMVGQSTVDAAKDFSKQVSYYIYYRIARQALYGADDKGSTSLYTNK